jgi:parallel beta-helix repeat protein
MKTEMQPAGEGQPPRRRERRDQRRKCLVNLNFFSASVSASSALSRRLPLVFAVVLIIAISCALQGFAAVYYVSPSGEDSAAGDVGHPFQTISHAADWAMAGDTVLIAPGIYRESVAITHSGTAEKPITFQAQKAGTAIITGADLLAVWIPVRDHPGQFISDWPHDFIIDHNPDGSPVRDHGAPAPVGCAEQILWEGHPLRMVMNADDLSPGCFWVDWQFHTLTVWLPGGIDARSAKIEGCARSYLISPLERDNVFADARYIALRGLVFQNAANFAQRGGVILGTGWHADHCIVEGNNAGGMSLDGNEILVDHCIAQYNGFCGISGSGDDNTIQDCIVRGNNWKGFPPGWEGGGGKFTNTHHLRVFRHTSYENTGPGIWLDIENTDYSITDSTIYGNRGLNADWEGSGICLEISPGPGVVSGNDIYSNTGAGILLAESEHITVDSNTLVDNVKGIELRAMSGRDNHQLGNIQITRNRFKEWRKDAIATSLGDWSPASIAQRDISIDRNVYDPTRGEVFFQWGDAALGSFTDIHSVLNVEQNGSVAAIAFAHSLENIRTIADSDRPTIVKALKDATVGESITIPVNSRSPVLDSNACAVFDHDNSCVFVALPTEELRRRMQDAVSTTPTALPVLVTVRIDQINPHQDFRATLVEIR